MKELPLEFKKINSEKIDSKNVGNQKVKIDFYQTEQATLDFFYKPISRIICIGSED